MDGPRHRFKCPLCSACHADTAHAHQVVARQLHSLCALHALYAALGGVHAADQVIPRGPYEIHWTAWGPVPMPLAREEAAL